MVVLVERVQKIFKLKSSFPFSTIIYCLLALNLILLLKSILLLLILNSMSVFYNILTSFLCISSANVFTNHRSLWSIFKHWKRSANILGSIIVTQCSDILTQLTVLCKITCGNCQFKNLFCFQNLLFLGTIS